MLLCLKLLTINEIPNSEKVKFYFDSIEIGTNMGQKNIKFSIPNSYYKKIKDFYSGIPNTLNDTQKLELMKQVRKGMGL